jgi:hypothetical protein
MTRSEAEEIYIGTVMSGESAAVEMTLPETQVFRVLIGRCMKDMERRNRSLWLKAREFGIEYKKPYCIIKKLDANRYKIYSIGADGVLTPKVRIEEAMSNFDNGEGNEAATS